VRGQSGSHRYSPWALLRQGLHRYSPRAWLGWVHGQSGSHRYSPRANHRPLPLPLLWMRLPGGMHIDRVCTVDPHTRRRRQTLHLQWCWQRIVAAYARTRRADGSLVRGRPVFRAAAGRRRRPTFLGGRRHRSHAPHRALRHTPWPTGLPLLLPAPWRAVFQKGTTRASFRLVPDSFQLPSRVVLRANPCCAP
jgi:hypothetical protein